MLKALANITTLMFTVLPPLAVLRFCLSHTRLLVVLNASMEQHWVILLCTPKIPSHKRIRVLEIFFSRSKFLHLWGDKGGNYNTYIKYKKLIWLNFSFPLETLSLSLPYSAINSAHTQSPPETPRRPNFSALYYVVLLLFSFKIQVPAHPSTEPQFLQ